MLLDVQRATTCVFVVSISDSLPCGRLRATASRHGPSNRRRLSSRLPCLFSLRSASATGLGGTDRIVGTGCATCCDVYRSWRYPSLRTVSGLLPGIRLADSSRKRDRRQARRTYSSWRFWLGVWLNDDGASSQLERRAFFRWGVELQLRSPNLGVGFGFRGREVT